MTPRRPTFEELNAAALARFDQVMALLGLAGGKRQGPEYLPLNPRRADHKPGSFSINVRTGAWADFAADAKGGDLVSLAAYVRSEGNGLAAAWLGEVLGFGSGGSGVEIFPPPINHAAASNHDMCETLHTSGKAQPNIRETFPGSEKTPPQLVEIFPQAGKAPPPQAGAWVHPVPEGAPRPPAGHPKHGRPSQVWTYRDAAGAVLFHHCRFDPRGQRKQFAPLTLWRAESGRLAWSWKWPPAPVPLYGLPELAARPDVPVVITEGEKACDAARELLPGCVAVTWAGGAMAVQKADLAPLAGREVLIWRDNDEPGEQAERRLILRLREISASPIRRVNLGMLERQPVIDAQGQPGLIMGPHLEPGADAADLLSEGWTPAHLRLLLDSGELLDTLAPPEPRSSDLGDSDAPVSPAFGFDMRENGLYRLMPGSKDRGEWWAPVCPPFEVLALVRDPEGAGWGLLLELRDPDRRRHRVIVPHRTLKGDGAAALEQLMDRGLVPVTGRDKYLIEFLRQADTDRRARVVPRVGWHGEGDKAVYVLPEQVFGARDGEVWLYEPDGPRLNPFKTRGSLAEWREHVATLAAGNSRLVFACSLAFAAPLVFLTDSENGGVNLVGHSGSGKTTALRVGGSVCGSPEYLERLRATDNGLEGTFLGKCDAPAFLDELGQLGPQVAGEAVYMAANGQAKARASRTGGQRERAAWRTLFLIAAETGLAGHMAEAGKAPKAGQQTRLADVPADAGAGLGVFEEIHNYASGHEFSQAITRACGKFYGTPFAAFLSRLLHERSPRLVEHLRESIRRFEREHLTQNAQGQARRVAARFGLIAAAGELARDWLELPWRQGEPTTAAGRLFVAWLEARGGESNSEERAMLAQVRDFLSRHGEARFTDWDRPAADSESHAPRVINRAGFRRPTDATYGKPPEDRQTEYLVFPEVWRNEVCRGFDPGTVARVLIRRGMLQPSDDNRPARSLTLPGEGKRRVYNVLPSVWAGEQ